MAILSTLPPLPEEHILARAQSQFYTIFKSHIFLRTITSLAPASNDVVPPYLKIGLACLGLASSIARPTGREPHPQWSIAAESSAADLFVAGDTLWGVMMEVDNREARLSESVLAVSAPYPIRLVWTQHLLIQSGVYRGVSLRHTACLAPTKNFGTSRPRPWPELPPWRGEYACITKFRLQ